MADITLSTSYSKAENGEFEKLKKEAAGFGAGKKYLGEFPEIDATECDMDWRPQLIDTRGIVQTISHTVDSIHEAANGALDNYPRSFVKCVLMGFVQERLNATAAIVTGQRPPRHMDVQLTESVPVPKTIERIRLGLNPCKYGDVTRKIYPSVLQPVMFRANLALGQRIDVAVGGTHRFPGNPNLPLAQTPNAVMRHKGTYVNWPLWYYVNELHENTQWAKLGQVASQGPNDRHGSAFLLGRSGYTEYVRWAAIAKRYTNEFTTTGPSGKPPICEGELGWTIDWRDGGPVYTDFEWHVAANTMVRANGPTNYGDTIAFDADWLRDNVNDAATSSGTLHPITQVDAAENAWEAIHRTTTPYSRMCSVFRHGEDERFRNTNAALGARPAERQENLRANRTDTVLIPDSSRRATPRLRNVHLKLDAYLSKGMKDVHW